MAGWSWKTGKRNSGGSGGSRRAEYPTENPGEQDH